MIGHRRWRMGLLAAAVLALGGAPAWSAPDQPAGGADAKDVVVTGKRPPAKCADKDKACLTIVATEIWKRFPKQIESYCFKQEWAAQQNRQNKEEFFGLNTSSALPDTHDTSAFADDLPPGLKFVCDFKPAKGMAR